MKHTGFARAGACVTALFAAPVWAGSDTASINVSGNVVSSISVRADNLDFGDMTRSATTIGSFAVYVTASSGVSYTVALNAGNHCASPCTGSRLMRDATDTYSVGYSLYSDSLRTVEWGDGGAGDTYPDGDTRSGTGNGAEQTFSGYARANVVPAANPNGAYTDVVTATVSW